MDNGVKIVAIIPARGGSKGLPRKNILPLLGKPLIAWTIEEAKKSKYLDRVVLSSEDAEIISVARQFGCDVPFVRPMELASDETPGVAPILHAIEALPEQYDMIVLLQPTSPLRLAADIDRSIELCIDRKAPACVSVTEPDISPFWMYTIGPAGNLQPLLKSEETYRRQDLPKVFASNGAVYVANCSWLLKTKTFVTDETIAYIMPRERSQDIDTELDLRFCEFLLRETRGNLEH
ncbi:MAG: acylneuraminate cytidylyltransferase family protein [Nitrospirae bacterium]|nr:acylneuraminate cytidylyltransferase family protein [Nitrospirota bacterium]